MPKQATDQLSLAANKAVDVADKAVDKIPDVDVKLDIDAFLSKLTAAMQIVSEKVLDVGAKAADLVLTIVQLKAIFELFVGFTFAIIPVVIAVKYTRRLVKWCADSFDDCNSAPIFVAVFVAIISIGMFIHGADKLTQFDNWLSAFSPVAGVAYKALVAAGINL